MKTCPKCGETKPVDTGFYMRHDRKTPQSWCKECMKDGDRQRARIRPPLSQRAQMLKKFGLTVEDYDRLLDTQSRSCAICHRSPPSKRHLAVDHCHETGRVRGLLCHSCNTALGRLGDTKEALLKVIAYLDATA